MNTKYGGVREVFMYGIYDGDNSISQKWTKKEFSKILTAWIALGVLGLGIVVRVRVGYS
jgi:hypothetical protein